MIKQKYLVFLLETRFALALQDPPKGINEVNPPLSATPYINIPASVAEIYDAIVPQIIALNPSLARSAFRFGTITPIPPS